LSGIVGIGSANAGLQMLRNAGAKALLIIAI